MTDFEKKKEKALGKTKPRYKGDRGYKHMAAWVAAELGERHTNDKGVGAELAVACTRHSKGRKKVKEPQETWDKLYKAVVSLDDTNGDDELIRKAFLQALTSLEGDRRGMTGIINAFNTLRLIADDMSVIEAEGKKKLTEIIK